MTVQLLPTKSRFGTDEPVAVEVRGATDPIELRVLHLGSVVATATGSGTVEVGPLPDGGYGIETDGARTAVQVGDATTSMRYGFVTSYLPDRDVAPVADTVRRLHLTDVQFYDWAYRHADLLGGGEQYLDALGQPIALDTVRRLVVAVHAAGARALGYAAVYGIGNDEWPTWQDAALLQATGKSYGLGDFLSLLDPADEKWLAHFTADLQASVESIGLSGFHLDQYGYPKWATRPDGTVVDVQESFATLIEAVREALPQSRLVFNNVNDFPTWRTAGTPQDAVYIEVWPPHTTLGHLADLVTRTRGLEVGKPVVVAAYQHVYDSAPAAESDHATALTMATLYSHGATQLLAGEGDRILVDPYYVRNHVVEHSTADLLRRWYDFAVEHDELLFTDCLADVTGPLAGDYNNDIDVTADDVTITEQPTAGALWRRIVTTGVPGRLVLHLVNLLDQADTEWDAARHASVTRPEPVLRIRRVGSALPRVRVADPDAGPALTDVPVAIAGDNPDYCLATLPPSAVWQLILIDLFPQLG